MLPFRSSSNLHPKMHTKVKILENISSTLNLIKELKVLNLKYNLINNEYSSLFKYLYIYNKSVTHCLITDNDAKEANTSIAKKTNLSDNKCVNENITDYFSKLNAILIANIQKSINWCKKHQFAINKEFCCY